MFRLFVNYYLSQTRARQNELDECLERNAANPLISHIHVLGTRPLITEKVIWLPFAERPTFDVFFEVINATSGSEDINVIANSDIFFDETLRFVNEIKRSQ